jgi:microcompartment protein CcmL/EutN
LEAIGLVEFSSIAVGIEAVDQMVKESDIRLVAARTSCSGKYVGLITGDVAGVRASVEKGIESARGHYIDSLIIPDVDERVIPAAAGAVEMPELNALGVIETFSLASALEAADAAAKTAQVTLIEVRLGTGIGGKGFVTLAGDTSSVRAAVNAGAQKASERGLLVATAVIPAPYRDVLDNLA